MKRMKMMKMKKIALAVAVSLLVLGAAEVVARLAGVGAVRAAFLVAEEGGRTVVRAGAPAGSEEGGAAGLLPMHPALFAVRKPAGTVRLLVFGGSTVFGMPYTLAAGGGDLSFVSYLREELQARHPEKTIEVINCGLVGETLSGVRELFEQSLDFEPDGVVVLSGHNEFLPHALLASRARRADPLAPAVGSRLWGLRLLAIWHDFVVSLEESHAPDLGTLDWPEVDEPVGPGLHSAEDFAEIVSHARATLEWIRRAALARGIPLVLATCPSNLADFEPSLSTLSRSDEERSADWMSRIREGRALLERGEAAAALERFESAESLDAAGAEAHYWRGRALMALGRREEALEALGQARDADGVIRRAPGAINQVIREVAGETGASLCAVEAAFGAASPGGIPGDDLMVDHVHPNLDGVACIAGALCKTLESGVIPALGAVRGKSPARDEILTRLGYTPLLQLRVDLQIGLSYANLILLRHWDPEMRYARAREHLRRVLDLIPEEKRGEFSLYPLACTYLGGIHAVAGQPEAAREMFAEAARYDPDWAAPLRDYMAASAVLRRLFKEAGVTIPGG